MYAPRQYRPEKKKPHSKFLALEDADHLGPVMAPPVYSETNAIKRQDESEDHEGNKKATTDTEQNAVQRNRDREGKEEHNEIATKNPAKAKSAQKKQLGREEKPPQLRLKAGSVGQFKSASGPMQFKEGTSEVANNSAHAGSGNGLPEGVKGQMESSFGTSFDDVKITANSNTAKRAGALAFAQGNDIHFAPGQYNPGSKGGQELLGHELAHVVQQREGRVKPTAEAEGMPVNNDKGLEAEADAMGAKAAQMKVDRTAIADHASIDGNRAAAVQMKMDPNASFEMLDDDLALDGFTRRSDEKENAEAEQDEEGSSIDDKKIDSDGLRRAKLENEKVLAKEKPEAEEGGLVNAEIKEGQPITIKPKQELREGSELPSDEKGHATNKNSKDKKETNDKGDRSKQGNNKDASGQKMGNPTANASETNTESDADSPLTQLQSFVPPPLPGEPSTEVSPAQLEAEEGIGEGEKQREAANLCAQINANGSEKSTALRKSAQEQAISIDKAVTDKKGLIQTESAAHAAGIKEKFAALRSDLIAHAAAKKAQAGLLLLAQQQQVELETEKKIKDSLQTMEEKKLAFGSHVLEEKMALVTIATAEAVRADRELEEAAKQAIAETQAVAARYKGGEDPKPKQRKAALDIGIDAAKEIRGKKADIHSELIEKAVEFGEKYDEYRDRVFQQVEDTRGQLVEALLSTKSETLTQLQENHNATIQRIDERQQQGWDLLDVTEKKQIATIVAKRDSALRDLDTLKQQSPQTIAALAKLIEDQIAEESQAAVQSMSGTEIFLKGFREQTAAVMNSINDKFQQGLEQMMAVSERTNSSIESTYQDWQQTSGAAKATAFAQGDSQLSGSKQNLDQAIELQTQGGKQILDGMARRQTAVFDQVVAQVDFAIEDAKKKIAELKAQFTLDIKKAADESIREGIKPLTDRASTRAEAAASRAGESAFKGFLRALGDILVGLLVVVVLAVILVAIASALAIALSFTAALLIIGAVFLAVALIVAIVNRAKQVNEGASAWWLLMAVPDAIGVTSLLEGIRGREYVTDKELSAGEAWYRGTTGFVQTALMVIGGIRGFRGGFRFPRMPRGGLSGMLGGIKNIPGAISGGLRNLRAAGGLKGALGRFTGSIKNSVKGLIESRGIKAREKAAAAGMDHAGPGAHPYGKHGAHTPIWKHFRRLLNGKAPNGQPGPKPDASSRFASNRKMIEAENAAWNHYNANPNLKYKKGNPAKGLKEGFPETIPLPEAGTSFSFKEIPVKIGGKTINLRIPQSEKVNSVRIFWKLDPATGRHYIYTMHPIK
jgi:hypothetical protein